MVAAGICLVNAGFETSWSEYVVNSQVLLGLCKMYCLVSNTLNKKITWVRHVKLITWMGPSLYAWDWDPAKKIWGS